MSRDDILDLGPEWPVDHASSAGVADPWTLVLAHGAGQGMDSPFMESMARLIAARGLRVVRFELTYMREVRRTGVRRPPDALPRLIATWHETLDRLADQGLRPERLLIGGKSLGGRMASLVAAERPVAGLVCLGYPFHAHGRPERTRVEHLRDFQVPTLICQGTRDPFGRPEEVAGYGLSPAIRLVWIEDGEHSLKPGRASARTWDQNLAEAADAVAEWSAAFP
jgi:predicted alpha/beta-hydrolase family hydrolase